MFVSVVVPLWLIATTSVSDMSSTSPKPESSVASIGSTRNGWPTPSAVVSAVARLWPGHRGGALTDHHHPADLARAKGRRRSAGIVLSASATRSAPSRSTSLPRRVVRKESGDSVISFSR